MINKLIIQKLLIDFTIGREKTYVVVIFIHTPPSYILKKIVGIKHGKYRDDYMNFFKQTV